ncbi:hypothetical protein KDN34_03020 [Shewanella yunxiaonensis]|uniref:Uncharacterized protein n=1 Tax=Shewanella yunxiaonensis TaxID=2829809 RepID=A0ABX7YVU1_9GAMM|nr:hypothetical protein [Shewanella yunxiaonensis]QUN06451.1 hypothetical protein KDN34_03020 [Shewanella yunxiaonensis]
MKLCRCPVCHSSLHLDALVQDDAARELLAELTKMNAGLARVMVAYIGLFRPEKSDLSWNRALKLTTETLAMASSTDLLREALTETVMKLRASRTDGKVRPLTNHNYLKRVLESYADAQGVSVTTERKPDRYERSGSATSIQDALMKQKNIAEHHALLERFGYIAPDPKPIDDTGGQHD